MSDETVPGTQCINPGCQHRSLAVRKRYKCLFCRAYLHPHALGCSDPAPDDDSKVCCPPYVGCAQKEAGSPMRTSSPESSSTETRQPTAMVMATPTRTSPRSQPLRRSPRRHPRVPTGRSPRLKIQKKRGPKRGVATVQRSQQFWYSLCSKFESLPRNTKQTTFLRAQDGITDSQSDRASFGQYLKKYRAGKLKPILSMRSRESPYVELEEKLAGYLQLRQQLYKKDKIGVGWLMLQEKLMGWKEQMEDQERYKDFKASPGFISNVLKRHGLQKIRLHGEASDLPEEERLQAVAEFREELHELCRKYSVTVERVFNADQTGLFYAKIPAVK